MADIEFTERPQLDRTVMIVAFAGWSDASESATRAIRYLANNYRFKRFARIDAEEHFDFTQTRPTVRVEGDRNRVLSWPSNEFSFWKSSGTGSRDLVALIGTEPHLRWRHFASLVMQVAEAANVELMITLGALLDAVPHSRRSPVMATASAERLGEGFDDIHLPGSRYQGPTGILSVIMDAMNRRGIPSVSLWGRAPHYVQARPNMSVTLSLLEELQPFLPVKLDLADIRSAAEEFQTNLERALQGQENVVEYVKKLEERYDREVAGRLGADPPPDASALIDELEQYLRRRQSGDKGDTSRG